jgi:NAD(P)-dependent dehydrogenase (short-subunit alcohol dehydrogenase family)
MSARRWFITGAARGLGLSIAQAALGAGDSVAATARRVESLAPLKEKYGDRIWTGRLDVTDAEQVSIRCTEAWEAFGGIDIVVNNSGYGLFGAAEEVSDEQLERLLATNLMGAIRVTRAFLPRMRQQRRGHIIQMSSAGGQLGSPGLSSYNTSKWGLEGYSTALAGEVSEFGIFVTIVEPGGVSTGFRSSLEYAEPISDYADTVVGQVRRMRQSRDDTPASTGDRVAAAIPQLTYRKVPPLRVAMGSDAYAYIRAALQSRLSELEAERTITLSTDAEPLADTTELAPPTTFAVRY